MCDWKKKSKKPKKTRPCHPLGSHCGDKAEPDPFGVHSPALPLGVSARDQREGPRTRISHFLQSRALEILPITMETGALGMQHSVQLDWVDAARKAHLGSSDLTSNTGKPH